LQKTPTAISSISACYTLNVCSKVARLGSDKGMQSLHKACTKQFCEVVSMWKLQEHLVLQHCTSEDGLAGAQTLLHWYQRYQSKFA
jgi:hypothetical protein